jgi:TM2 domain-containing membrane protein YozV
LRRRTQSVIVVALWGGLGMTLSTQHQLLIEQRVTNEAKSIGAAYLLWLFFGMLGGHRFYLGKIGTAIVQLLMSVIGWLTVVVGIGFVILAIEGIWVLIDAFLIPGMVQADKAKLRQSLTTDAILAAGAARQDRQIGPWAT